MLLTMNGTLTVVFSSGQDEQDALEDRAEAEGVAEHHRHADDLQRSRHDLSHVPQEGATGEEYNLEAAPKKSKLKSSKSRLKSTAHLLSC